MYTVLCSYLLAWIATSIGLGLTARKLQDPVQPASHPIPILVAAGAAWPLVVLGVTQMAIVALVARSWNSHSIRKRVRAFADNELDDLLDEWLNTPGADARYQVGT
jgi:hypothetical protein